MSERRGKNKEAEHKVRTHSPHADKCDKCDIARKPPSCQGRTTGPDKSRACRSNRQFEKVLSCRRANRCEMDDLPVAGSVSLTPEAVRFNGWAQDCGGAFERRLLLRVSPEASSPVRVLVCGPTTARFELELACSSSPSGSGAAPDQDERALQIRNPEGTADRMFFGLLLPASTTVALIVRFHPPPTGTTDFLWSNFADAITVFAVEGAQSCAAKVTSRVVHMRATRHDEDQTGSAADISSFKPSVALLSLPVLARGALSCLAKSRGGQKDGAAAVGGDSGVGTEEL